MKKATKKRWTDEEIAYIMAQKSSYVGDIQLAMDLGRTLESVRMKRMWVLKGGTNQKKKKIKKGKEYYSRWTFDELDMITDSNKTDLELSKILGRSENSIRVKRYQLEKENNAREYA